MNIKSQFSIAVLLCIFSLGVFAQDSDQEIPTSRSVGKQVRDETIDLRETLKSRTITESIIVETPQSRANNVPSNIANRHDQHFSIFDFDVELISDLDGDGYHHALNVIFDVDVDYDGATLYAKLFLSREGGPWIQYNTTDLFDIFEDDIEDEYEVTTELIDGYPAGYYAVLIEIYSLNHVDVVASEILDHHNLGKDIMLEDLNRDEEVIFEEFEVSVSHGGGSFSLIYWLLLVQVVIAARGALTLSPRKTIIIRNGISALRSFFLTVLITPKSTR